MTITRYIKFSSLQIWNFKIWIHDSSADEFNSIIQTIKKFNHWKINFGKPFWTIYLSIWSKSLLRHYVNTTRYFINFNSPHKFHSIINKFSNWKTFLENPFGKVTFQSEAKLSLSNYKLLATLSKFNYAIYQFKSMIHQMNFNFNSINQQIILKSVQINYYYYYY